VKVITSKARGGRSLAQGNLRHEDKLLGYHGKVSGKKMVKKQGIKNKILLECTVCKKKHQRVVSERLRKKVEISK
jgi:ribosomal protein L44E